jgi:hypothetical protein
MRFVTSVEAISAAGVAAPDLAVPAAPMSAMTNRSCLIVYPGRM